MVETKYPYPDQTSIHQFGGEKNIYYEDPRISDKGIEPVGFNESWRANFDKAGIDTGVEHEKIPTGESSLGEIRERVSAKAGDVLERIQGNWELLKEGFNKERDATLSEEELAKIEELKKELESDELTQDDKKVIIEKLNELQGDKTDNGGFASRMGELFGDWWQRATDEISRVRSANEQKKIEESRLVNSINGVISELGITGVDLETSFVVADDKSIAAMDTFVNSEVGSAELKEVLLSLGELSKTTNMPVTLRLGDKATYPLLAKNDILIEEVNGKEQFVAVLGFNSELLAKNAKALSDGEIRDGSPVLSNNLDRLFSNERFELAKAADLITHYNQSSIDVRTAYELGWNVTGTPAFQEATWAIDEVEAFIERQLIADLGSLPADFDQHKQLINQEIIALRPEEIVDILNSSLDALNSGTNDYRQGNGAVTSLKSIPEQVQGVKYVTGDNGLKYPPDLENVMISNLVKYLEEQLPSADGKIGIQFVERSSVEGQGYVTPEFYVKQEVVAE